jgi:hypothetical protein
VGWEIRLICTMNASIPGQILLFSRTFVYFSHKKFTFGYSSLGIFDFNSFLVHLLVLATAAPARPYLLNLLSDS